MKQLILILSIFLLPILFSPASYSEENPFLANRTKNAQTVQVTENTYYPESINRFFNKLNKTQRDLNKEIARLTRDIKENRSPKSLFILIAISFLYGAFHSIGPGHGKCFVCSYFLSEKNDIKKGILLGNLVAIIHAVSALTIVSVIYFVFKTQNLVFFENVSRSVSIFSYSLIICIGLSLFIKNVFGLFKNRKKSVSAHHIHEPERGHDHQESIQHIHGPDCNHEHHDHQHLPEVNKNQNIFLIAASIGLVPCPGAITILLFSISLDIVQLGVLLAFFIALGMGITVSITGILTILTRQGTLKVFSGQGRISKLAVENTMKILGSIMILCFGTFFLVGNL